MARAQGVGQPHRTLVGIAICMTQSGAGVEQQSVFRDGPSASCVLARSHAFAGSWCGVREPENFTLTWDLSPAVGRTETILGLK